MAAENFMPQSGSNESRNGLGWRLAAREPIEVFDAITRATFELKLGQSDPGNIEGLLIDFRYEARDGEVTRRLLLCWQCLRLGDLIYVRGYCPFREGLRTFRVDRMADLIALAGERDTPIDDIQSYFAAFAAEVAEEGPLRRLLTNMA